MRILLGTLGFLCLFTLAAQGDEHCLAHAIPFTDSGKAASIQYGRSRPMDIRHIRLDLRVDVEGERLEGTATHTLVPIGAPLRTATFDSVGLDVTKVSAGGHEFDFEVGPEKLNVFFPSPIPDGEELALKIEYSVTRPAKGMHFRTPRLGYSGTEVQCWSQGESEDSRYWFPCFDTPHERSTTEIVATVPALYRATANGELVDVQENAADGTHTFHYRLDKEHAVYLVSLAVGQFVEIRDDSGPVPLFYYVLPGQEEKARLSFGRTADMMRYFESTLGVPYPWGRYSQVAVVDFIAGGMENTSITTLTERSVQDAAARLTNLSEHLVSHELAHQWFGDYLTTRDWTNIWLNEGWATYLETCYTGHNEGPDAYLHRMWENAQDVFETDKPENRLATVRKAWGDPEALFDARVYEKGAWILHMLRRRLGDEVFWRGAHLYLERYANQSVETNDFLRTMEEVSGDGLEAFFDQWVFHAGWPEFKIGYEWDNERNVAKVTVEQTQKVDDKTLLFTGKTAIRFALSDGVKDEEVELTEKSHTFYVALPSRPEYVRFDPNDHFLKTAQFDRSKDMLIAQLSRDDNVLARYEACDALGKLRNEGAIEALTKALDNDTFWGVRARAVQALAGMDLPKAEEAVIGALKQDNPRVRLAAARALSKVRSDASKTALAALFPAEPSPYVVAAAIDSLSQQLAFQHGEDIRKLLSRDSQNQVIRNAALSALARLEPNMALPAILDYTRPDAPRMSRGAAVNALGVAGQWSPEKAAQRKPLIDLLDDRNPFIRRGAADALGTLGDPEAIPALEAFALGTKDELEAKTARDNAAKLRDRNTPPNALKQLQEQLDAMKKDIGTLQEDKKKLQGEMESLKASTNPTSDAKSKEAK
jgi:aminopeptidase N